MSVISNSKVLTPDDAHKLQEGHYFYGHVGCYKPNTISYVEINRIYGARSSFDGVLNYRSPATQEISKFIVIEYYEKPDIGKTISKVKKLHFPLFEDYNRYNKKYQLNASEYNSMIALIEDFTETKISQLTNGTYSTIAED